MEYVIPGVKIAFNFGGLTLFTHHQDMETIGKDRWAGSCSWGRFGRWTEFRSEQIHAVVLRIDGHRACAALGRNVVHRFVFSVHSPNDAQRSVTSVGTECEAEAGVEARAVRVRANRGRCNHLEC